MPGFEHILLLQSANTLGIRETRRIGGEYELSLSDMKEGRHFEDAIATVGSAVDFHASSKADGSYDGAYGLVTAKTCQIPYRSLIPKKTENLLAAGTAAALALKKDGKVRDVDGKELREQLIKDGAVL